MSEYMKYLSLFLCRAQSLSPTDHLAAFYLALQLAVSRQVRWLFDKAGLKPTCAYEKKKCGSLKCRCLTVKARKHHRVTHLLLHMVLFIPPVVKTCSLCMCVWVDPRGARLCSASIAASRGWRPLASSAGPAALCSETLPRRPQHHRDGSVRVPWELQVRNAHCNNTSGDRNSVFLGGGFLSVVLLFMGLLCIAVCCIPRWNWSQCAEDQRRRCSPVNTCCRSGRAFTTLPTPGIHTQV